MRVVHLGLILAPLVAACTHEPSYKHCWVDGDPNLVVSWQGKTAPPGWRLFQFSFENEVSCLTMEPHKMVEDTVNDAGAHHRLFHEAGTSFVIDHPAVGSKVTLAIKDRGYLWYYGVEWDKGPCRGQHLTTNDWRDPEDGGVVQIVPPSTETGCR